MHAESSSVSWAMVAQLLGPGDPGRSSAQELRRRLMRGRRFGWSIAWAAFGERFSRGLGHQSLDPDRLPTFGNNSLQRIPMLEQVRGRFEIPSTQRARAATILRKRWPQKTRKVTKRFSCVFVLFVAILLLSRASPETSVHASRFSS